MCDIAAECWNLGLSDSTGFSISAKIPNTPAILVDKSGTGFRRNKISLSDLLMYDEQGELLYKPEGSDNPRLAPVNTVIHLAGYRANKNLLTIEKRKNISLRINLSLTFLRESIQDQMFCGR